MKRYDSRIYNEASRRADDLSILLKIKLDFNRVKMVSKTFMLTCKNPDRPQQIPPIIIPTTKALLTPIFGSFKEELYC